MTRKTVAGIAVALVVGAVALWDWLGPAAQLAAAAVLVGVTWRYVTLTGALVMAQREAPAREFRERHRVEVLMRINAVLHLLDSYFVPYFIKWTGQGGDANVIRDRTREYFHARVDMLADHTASIATHAPLLDDPAARNDAITVVSDIVDLVDRARGVAEAFAQGLEGSTRGFTTFGDVRNTYDNGPVHHAPRFDDLLSVGALNGYRNRASRLRDRLFALSPADRGS